MGSAIEGKRLERYIRQRWDREQGGIRGLAEAAGVSADAIHGWFRGAEPSLGALVKVATKLGVRPYELVAVMYGDEPTVALDEDTRDLIAEMVAVEVQRRLDQPLL